MMGNHALASRGCCCFSIESALYLVSSHCVISIEMLLVLKHHKSKKMTDKHSGIMVSWTDSALFQIVMIVRSIVIGVRAKYTERL